MDTLILKPQSETPSIILNKKDGIFSISGKSLPENAVEFYAPIFNWLDNYIVDPNDVTVFIFNMEYYNSASSKIILNILNRLEKLSLSGKSVKVEWHYKEEDEDMEESGHEYNEILNIDFEFLPYV